MGTRLVTGPTEEPLTLTEAKAHLRVVIPDDDGLIAGYILAARTYVEGQIHRAICTSTWEYTIDGGWPFCGYEPIIEVPLPPLQSVSTVIYVDSDGTAQTLAASQYTVIANRPKGAIVPAYGVTWPTVRDVPEAIRVTFNAGFTVVPDDLRTALLAHVELLYDRDPQMIERLAETVEILISPYRVPTF
jgi:uncharacterized phiE125 gp8 family phage protein